jgi:Ssp1 endopeptidase immunity protein Rap1a
MELAPGVIAAVIVSVVLPTATAAEAPRTGKFVLEKCMAEDRAWCLGFVSGVAATASSLAVDERDRLCLPGWMSTEAQRMTVVDFLRKNPNALNAPPAYSVWLALSESYRCKR